MQMSLKRFLSPPPALKWLMQKNITTAAASLNSRIDPLKMLYEQKLLEYQNKSSGGKMVDPSPEILKELEAELKRVTTKYGFENQDELTKFPEFTFEEPKIDPIVKVDPNANETG